jgi:hypothetical protein
MHDSDIDHDNLVSINEFMKIPQVCEPRDQNKRMLVVLDTQCEVCKVFTHLS